MGHLLDYLMYTSVTGNPEGTGKKKFELLEN